MGCASSTEAVAQEQEHQPNPEAAKWKSSGDTAFDSKNYDEAIEHYTKAAEADPQFGSPFYNRGLCHEKNGQHKLAIADLQHAQKMLKTPPALRRCADAIERIRKELPADVSEAKALQHKKDGDGHFDKANWELAITSYSLSIEMDPDYGEPFYNRGLVHEKREHWHEAIADLEIAELLLKKPNFHKACQDALHRVRSKVPKDEQKIGELKTNNKVVVLTSSITTTTEQEREQREASQLLTGQGIDHDVIDATLAKAWAARLRALSGKTDYPQIFYKHVSCSYHYVGNYKALQKAADEGRLYEHLHLSITTTTTTTTTPTPPPTQPHPPPTHHAKPKPPPPTELSAPVVPTQGYS